MLLSIQPCFVSIYPARHVAAGSRLCVGVGGYHVDVNLAVALPYKVQRKLVDISELFMIDISLLPGCVDGERGYLIQFIPESYAKP